MTSSENSVRRLADRLIQALDCDACQGYVRKYSESMDKIESLLSEAMAEARTDGDRKLREEASKGLYTPDREALYERKIAKAFQDGRSAAYRDAAEIADEHNSCTNKDCCGAAIADKLRQKAEDAG